MDRLISGQSEVLNDKKRSFTVLNTMYHETRQEIEFLKKQVEMKDNIIVDLKSRLGRHERIYISLGDEDPLVLGPSKSLVESLVKQMCKQKKRTEDLESKAVRQAEEIQRLNMELREKELQLETIRCEPGHEKDQEIHRLRSALEEKERTEATRTVLCSSLAEETDQLRGQLSATVQVCQELLARMKKDKEEGGGGEEVVEMFQLQTAKEQTSEPSDLSAAKSQICKLQEENQQLKLRVVYVQGLNSQWQKYDSSREDYIRGLCQRLKESAGQGSFSSGLLHQEISRLNSLLQEKIKECTKLNKEVEEIQRRSQDRIQTLEQQAVIYKDDFLSERADRERAQGKIENLKEHISQLKQQLQKQQGPSRETRGTGPLCRVYIPRISTRQNKDSSEALFRITTERPRQPAEAAAAAAATNLNTLPGLSELECPHCSARFSDTEVAECMNHLEECVRL